jgi:hypothetical protein
VPTSPSGTLPDTNATYKVPGTTISSNLFRMDGATANRLVYLGKIKNFFSVSASISFEGDNGSTDLLFYFCEICWRNSYHIDYFFRNVYRF